MSDVAVNAHDHGAVRGRVAEDWLSIGVGMLVFALALLSVGGIDLLDWAVTTVLAARLWKIGGGVLRELVWFRNLG